MAPFFDSYTSKKVYSREGSGDLNDKLKKV